MNWLKPKPVPSIPLRVPALVAHVKDLLGVVAGNACEGEGGEDDCDDAGGHEASLEGVLGRRVVILQQRVHQSHFGSTG